MSVNHFVSTAIKEPLPPAARQPSYIRQSHTAHLQEQCTIKVRATPLYQNLFEESFDNPSYRRDNEEASTHYYRRFDLLQLQ